MDAKKLWRPRLLEPWRAELWKHAVGVTALRYEGALQAVEAQRHRDITTLGVS